MPGTVDKQLQRKKNRIKKRLEELEEKQFIERTKLREAEYENGEFESMSMEEFVKEAMKW